MLRAIRNLDYTIILCQDLGRMRHFYHEVLGFPLYTERPEWIEFQVGASLLTLRPRGRTYDGPPPPPDSACLQLAFRVTPAQVDSCYVELQQKGVLIIEPPTDKVFGHRTLFFKDPEGNILEIYADL
jgi:catechol-2,3-dioxygenase